MDHPSSTKSALWRRPETQIVVSSQLYYVEGIAALWNVLSTIKIVVYAYPKRSESNGTASGSVSLSGDQPETMTRKLCIEGCTAGQVEGLFRPTFTTAVGDNGVAPLILCVQIWQKAELRTC